MIDKAEIIEAIKRTDDENLLNAINQMLQKNNKIPDWHIEELRKRMKDIEEGNAVFHDWEEVKDSIFLYK